MSAPTALAPPVLRRLVELHAAARGAEAAARAAVAAAEAAEARYQQEVWAVRAVLGVAPGVDAAVDLDAGTLTAPATG